MLRNRQTDRRLFALMVRCLSGESSEREVSQLQAHLSVDNRTADTFEAFSKVWAVSDVAPATENPDEAIERLRELRSTGCGASIHTLPRRADRRAIRTTSRGGARYALRVASVLAAVVALAVAVPYLFRSPAPETPAPVQNVFATARGQRAVVQLTDGTRVQLNVNSRLTVPETFAENRREVYLEGQAYFEVATDSARPFIAHTRNAAVRVLGTTFDVRAYPDESGVEVVVAEGKVLFGGLPDSSRLSQAVRDSVLLEKGQGGRLTAGGKIVHTRSADLRRLTAWTHGRLIFRDAPFEVVSRELERWYDLDIRLDAPPRSVNLLLNASFGEEPLSEILNAVSIALNLEYERTRREIVFRPVARR